jgi:DNA-binding NtrC family response regulator
MKTIQIVLAEEGRPVRILLEKPLEEEGRILVAVKSGAAARQPIRQEEYDRALLDQEIPDFGRLDSFRRGSEDEGDSDLLVVTTRTQIETPAEAIEPEAYHFLTKPLSKEEIQEALRLAEQMERPGESRISKLREKLLENNSGPVIGEGEAMHRLLQLVERVASANATVLIQGETGSGKGMVSRILHELSPRADQRLVAINCGAFQDQLLESELFGHERGAFTGALNPKPGLFEVADKGTLFLDEVAEMTPAMQAKLLQVLDAGELRRVGGTSTRTVDVRIIAASNKDLKHEVKEGRFREDLLFRLNVVTLTVPSLRQRKEEIPELLEGFLERFADQGLPRKTFSPEAVRLLQSHAWPGNVRELTNTIEGLLLLAPEDIIRPEDLPQSIRPSVREEAAEIEAPVPLTEIERVHIARVLRYTEGKKAPASRLLGIDVKTLNNKIRAYEIDLPT